MDVQIAVLKAFQRSSGDEHKAGEILVVGNVLAEQWISEGNACYYSDFTSDMIQAEEKTPEGVDEKPARGGRLSRVKKTPEGVD